MSTIKVDTYLTRGGASEIAIDKLKGVTAAGSMLVVAEGGTNTTNLQQGLSKAWINMNGTGTIAIRDSFNITSIADNATGRYTPTITNNMSSDDYAGFGGGCVNETTSNNQQARQGPSINVQATANFQINCGSNTYAQDDWEQPTAGLLGDLA
jgi:hypothetical protein